MPSDYTIEEIKAYLASPIREYRKQLTDRASTKGTMRIRQNALRGFYRYASHMLITDEDGNERRLYTPSVEMDAFLFIGRKPKRLPPDQPKQPQPRVHALEPNFAFSPESDWGRCVESFLRRTFEKSGSRSTLDHYRAILTRFFNGPPAKLPHLYTREDCESFLHLPGRATGRIGKPTTHATMNNALSCLKSF